jgi:hypothetical protein
LSGYSRETVSALINIIQFLLTLIGSIGETTHLRGEVHSQAFECVRVFKSVEESLRNARKTCLSTDKRTGENGARLVLTPTIYSMDVLLVDDLIATGGTAEAAAGLIQEMGGEVVECCFVIDLPDIGGRARLEKLGHKVFALCEFSGD